MERARRYARKSLRDCSEFCVEHTFSRRLVFRRDLSSSPIMAMLNNIDAYMQRGELLKAGNSATVVRVPVGDQNVVVKRYNLKNWRHALRRALQPSRAARAWQAGHQLSSLGVATPQPLVLLEYRIGPFRRKSYLITQALEGPNLQAYVHDNGPTPAIVEASVDALVRLHRAELIHGDTKATNFIVAEPTVWMVDLDGVRTSGRRHEAEVNRFLANWVGAEALAFSEEFARQANKP